jgi:uncharacterized protein (TIGR03083 family)
MNGSALSREDHLHTLRVESSRLAATDPAHLSLPLPHIDNWTVHNVIGHTGWVFRWISLILTAPLDEPPRRSSVPEPPAGTEVLSWFSDAAVGVNQALEAADPERLVTTFTGPQPTTWWHRRVAHETSMHRWDVESAFTTPEPIDTRVARDGIDEVFDVFVPARMHFDVLAGRGETIHLHATDIEDGEWVLTLHADRVEAEHAHTKADVAARGRVSDLLLLLWGRIPPSRLELFGESSLLDRWQRAATF